MPHLPRALLLSSLAAALVVLLASPAAAADRSACTAVRSHHPCTILRPLPGAPRSAPFGTPECIVVVGGLGSRLEEFGRFFDPVVRRLDAAADGTPYRITYFGIDEGETHPFAPYGAIGVNAAHLRGLVRDLADECSAIHVVAHSMGGAVADRAFSMGLSVDDRVATYLPISSPHNGAFAARALRLGLELDDRFATVVSAVARRTGLHDPASPAVRDLGRRPRAPRPPRGVATVRQRIVTDITVLRQDNVDRRVDVREYLPVTVPEWEGHSGAIQNAHVQRIVEGTIRAHRVPSDDRSAAEVRSAAIASRLVEHYWGGVVAAAGLALSDVALGTAIGSGETATVVGRASELAPDALELVEAASALRDPFPLTLVKAILGTALE